MITSLNIYRKTSFCDLSISKEMFMMSDSLGVYIFNCIYIYMYIYTYIYIYVYIIYEQL